MNYENQFFIYGLLDVMIDIKNGKNGKK